MKWGEARRRAAAAAAAAAPPAGTEPKKYPAPPRDMVPETPDCSLERQRMRVEAGYAGHVSKPPPLQPWECPDCTPIGLECLCFEARDWRPVCVR